MSNNFIERGSDKTIIFVRHGATTWTSEERYNSRVDLTLSARGTHEARNLAAFFRSSRFDVVYSSPAKRAIETAEILCSGRDIRPLKDARLVEIDLGSFEGKSREEVTKPPLLEAFEAWSEGKAPGAPEGIETFEEAAKRAIDFFEEIRLREGLTVVVSHGIFLRILICTCALGLTGANFSKLQIDSGSYSEISCNGPRSRLRALNVVPFARAFLLNRS